jgi:hypothetical protein
LVLNIADSFSPGNIAGKPTNCKYNCHNEILLKKYTTFINYLKVFYSLFKLAYNQW